MIHLRGWVFVGALFLTSIPSLAEPPVEKLRINGLDVYLINTRYGNEAAVTVSVPNGSWHDEPTKRAGLAHLWEHIIHRGSNKYPSMASFKSAAAEAGAIWNAYTASDRIFYHGFTSAPGLEIFARAQGALVSSPKFDPNDSKAETDVVMGEAKSYQAQDDTALQALTFLTLLPEGHPLRMYEVGFQSQLSQLTLEDLKDLYYSNYPNMRVILAANFDEPHPEALTREKAIRIITENYFAPQPPAGFVPSEPLVDKKFPLFVDGTVTNRLVEIGSTNKKRTLNFAFSSDSDWVRNHPGAQSLLLQYLKLSAAGSLEDRLQRTGWINSLSVDTTTVNNLCVADITLDLTEAGASHRDEIADYLFATLDQVAKNGIPENIFSSLKKRMLALLKKSEKSAQSLASIFSTQLLRDPSHPERLLDFKSVYDVVQIGDLQAGVRHLFNLDQMIIGYLAPENTKGTLHPEFQRPVHASTAADKIERWKKRKYSLSLALPQPELQEVPLPAGIASEQLKPTPTPTARVLANHNFRKAPGDVILLRSDFSGSEGGIYFSYHRPPASSVTRQLADALYAQAFAQRFKSQINSLSSQGVSVGVDSSLEFSAEGDATQAKAAIQWLLQTYASFQPNEAELEIFRGKILSSIERGEQTFSAQLAASAANMIVNRGFPPSEIAAAMQKLTLAEAIATFESDSKRGELVTSIAGHFNDNDAFELAQAFRQWFPEGLTADDRRRIEQGEIEIRSTAAYLRPLVKARGDHAYGVVRRLNGPGYRDNFREVAAFKVFVAALAEEVFQLNRSTKGLGYVHRAGESYSRQQKAWSLDLMGETDILTAEGKAPVSGHDRVLEIFSGWDELADRTLSRMLSPSDFKSQKSSQYFSGILIPSSPLKHAVGQANDYIIYGDPDFRMSNLKVYSELTPAEIYDVAIQYWHPGAPYLEVIAHYGTPTDKLPCAKLLTSDPETVRKLLAGS